MRSVHSVLLAVLVAAVLGTTLWSYGKSFGGIDFYQFWVVPTAHRDGEVVDRYAELSVREALGEKYYQKFRSDADQRTRSVAEARRKLDTVSTPFLYAVFSLFSGNSYGRDYDRYLFISLAAFIAAVGAICLSFGWTWLGAAALLTLLSSAWEPLLSELRVANVNRLLAAALCVCVVLRHPRCPKPAQHGTGWLLGLMLMFKPVMIGSAFLFVWLKVLERRWREALLDAAAIVGGAALAFLAGAAYFGTFSVWFVWMKEFLAMEDALIAVELGNYSPQLALAAWTGLGRSTVALAGGVLITALFSLSWLNARRRSGGAVISPYDSYRFEAGALLGGIILFFFISKLVWIHYLLLATPLFALLLRPSAELTSRVLARSILTGAAILLLGFKTWLVWFGSVSHGEFQAAVFLGLVFLAAAIAIDQSSAKLNGAPQD